MELFENASSLIFGIITFGLVLFILMKIALWKVFQKAGFKGCESLIPMHNLVVRIQIAGKPISYFFLLLIPVANIVFMIKIIHGMSKSFGKGVGFTFGLIFLPIIFLPILAFGSAEYIGINEDQQFVNPEPVVFEEEVAEIVEEHPVEESNEEQVIEKITENTEEEIRQ